MAQGRYYQELEAFVQSVDPSLQYIDYAGRGDFGVVAKVAKGSEVYALKIATAAKDLVHEFEVQSKLKGIAGVPEAVHMYSKRAFLMQFIDGQILYRAPVQGLEFFRKLSGIAEQIFARGYSLPDDFGRFNILVDKGSNPWVIDFAQAEKLDRNNGWLVHESRGALEHLECNREHLWKYFSIGS